MWRTKSLEMSCHFLQGRTWTQMDLRWLKDFSDMITRQSKQTWKNIDMSWQPEITVHILYTQCSSRHMCSHITCADIFSIRTRSSIYVINCNYSWCVECRCTFNHVVISRCTDAVHNGAYILWFIVAAVTFLAFFDVPISDDHASSRLEPRS